MTYEDYPVIKVKYASQMTGFDMNCKERMEMIRRSSSSGVG